MQYSEELSQRIEDCRELYFKYGGKRHDLIEKEMRALGHSDFHRRILYRRFERGTCQPGWIETYGWDRLLKERVITNDELRITNPVLDSEIHHSSFEIHNSVEPASDSEIRNSSFELRNSFDEFKEWLKLVSPTMQWEFKHQVYIYKRLKKVTDGDIKRLMIFMPPRHGKSEMVTVRYAAWRLKQDPAMNVIIASHTQQLANRFSRKIKRVLCEDFAAEMQRRGEAKENLPRINADAADRSQNDSDLRYPRSSAAKIPPQQSGRAQNVFPFVSSRPKNTEAEWETTMGGGLRAVGVGSGVTGFGANLIIIDDPVKSRAEAESKVFRERLWSWFNDDIRTRLEPDGSIVLIQTRWHEDDLAGRLLRESQEEGGEQWEVVNLPALAESETIKNDELRITNSEPISDLEIRNLKFVIRNSNDPLDRAPGDSLWPERFPEQLLDKLKRQMGSYSFASLYQQRPTPAEGGLFKRAWFKIINTPPPGLKWTRGYDLGISKNATADYTASMRIAFDSDKNMYIDGGFRARIEYPEQRRYILGRINAERDTLHGIELSANGNAVIQDLRKSRLTQGRALRGLKAKGDKVTHALPWIALAEEGRIFLVRGPWNTEFIEEAATFPLGTHDDQIDAVSLALRLQRERAGKLITC